MSGGTQLGLACMHKMYYGCNRMKLKQILLIGIIFAVLSVPVFVADAGAQCAVLPDSWCNGSGGEETITNLLWFVVNLMVAGVAVLALVGLVYGAILYTTAGGSQEKVRKAMEVFRNVAIGVLVFAVMWVVLQWLIPTGVETDNLIPATETEEEG